MERVRILKIGSVAGSDIKVFRIGDLISLIEAIERIAYKGGGELVLHLESGGPVGIQVDEEGLFFIHQ